MSRKRDETDERMRRLSYEQSNQIRTLLGKIAALEGATADYNMLRRENVALRKRCEWLEWKVNEREIGDVA